MAVNGPDVNRKSVLVCGAGGFLGGWTCRRLATDGHEVTGLARDELDLTDPAAVVATVGRLKPDVIVNAGGVSSPRQARLSPDRCFAINTGGVFNLLEAIRTGSPGSRLVTISSAAVYGPGAGEPLTENDPPAPHSVYAAAKLAAEVLTGQYIRAGWVDATTLRAFNLIGPGQPSGQAAASFAAVVRDTLAAGEREVSITVSDPGIARDFTDVRDAAAAISLVLDTPGVFNLCSGRATSLIELADTLAELAGGISGDRSFAVHLDTDPERERGGSPRRLCGSAARLGEATGWQPGIPVRDSLAGMLAEDRPDDGGNDPDPGPPADS